jgi:hypothetical protein
MRSVTLRIGHDVNELKKNLWSANQYRSLCNELLELRASSQMVGMFPYSAIVCLFPLLDQGIDAVELLHVIAGAL